MVKALHELVWDALSGINRNRGMTAAEIAAKHRLPEAAVNQVLEELVRGGQVQQRWTEEEFPGARLFEHPPDTERALYYRLKRR